MEVPGVGGPQQASEQAARQAAASQAAGAASSSAQAQAARPVRPAVGAAQAEKQKVPPVPAIGTPKQRLALARAICTLDLRGALSAVKTAATEAHVLGKVQDDDIYLPSLHEEALRTALKDFDVKTRLALRRILRLKAGLTNLQANAATAGAGPVSVTQKPAKKAASGTAAVQPNQQGELAVKSEARKVRKVVKRRVADAETETTKDTKASPAATVQEEPAAQVPQRRVTKGKPAEADSGKRAQSQHGGEQSSPAQLREVRRKASSPSPCSSRSICARRTPSPSFRPRRMKGPDRRMGRSPSPRRRDSRAPPMARVVSICGIGPVDSNLDVLCMRQVRQLLSVAAIEGALIGHRFLSNRVLTSDTVQKSLEQSLDGVH